MLWLLWALLSGEGGVHQWRVNASNGWSWELVRLPGLWKKTSKQTALSKIELCPQRHDVARDELQQGLTRNTLEAVWWLRLQTQLFCYIKGKARTQMAKSTFRARISCRCSDIPVLTAGSGGCIDRNTRHTRAWARQPTDTKLLPEAPGLQGHPFSIRSQFLVGRKITQRKIRKGGSERRGSGERMCVQIFFGLPTTSPVKTKRLNINHEFPALA